MAYRNPASINASQGLQEFLIFASEVTNYWFGNMIVITVFMISLSSYLYIYGTKDFWDGCTVSGYFTFIIGLLLWLMGVITGPTMALIIGAMVALTMALWIRR